MKLKKNYCVVEEMSKIPKEKSVRVFLLVVCLSVFCGCDNLYRLIQKEGAEEKALVGEVLPYEKNETIEEIQNLLKICGYNPGRVDGVFGVKTREALARFQRENGLKETRFADQETWARLNLFKDNKLVVDGKVNIQLIQGLLEKAGFAPGKADGKYGPKTELAIKNFQKEVGLISDGKIGPKTLSKLMALVPRESSEQ